MLIFLVNLHLQCELDIMFHLEKAHFMLEEMVMNGCIVETSKSNILTPIQLMDKMSWRMRKKYAQWFMYHYWLSLLSLCVFFLSFVWMITQYHDHKNYKFQMQDTMNTLSLLTYQLWHRLWSYLFILIIRLALSIF